MGPTTPAPYMGRIGSILLFGVFSQFYSIFPKNGISKVESTGFYSIPASPSNHFSGEKKSSVWAKRCSLEYIHASVRSLNDLPICHMRVKSHGLLQILTKAQNASCAIPRQSLAKYYYQQHIHSPKLYKIGEKTSKKQIDSILPPYP